MILRILHIDTGLSWRGGQKQLQLLLSELPRETVESHLVLPQSCEYRDKFAGLTKNLFCKNFGPLQQLFTAYQLARYCQSNAIDILHVHTARAHTIAVFIKLLLARKIPLIVHRQVIFPPSRNIFHPYKYGPQVVSQFIAISEAVRRALLSSGVAPQLVTTIKASYQGRGNMLNPEDKRPLKQQLCQEVGFDPQRIVIGFLGALSAEKGCFDLLKAVDFLRRDLGENPQVLIAGDGPLRRALEAEITRRKLQDSVKLLGFRDEVEDFLGALDILVFPSTSEGLGLGLLEAAFALCAVVATRVGGINEVIIHEKTGLLVNPSSPREIVKELRQLMANPLLRLKLAVNLRAHVKKNFSPRQLGTECNRLYQRIFTETKGICKL